MKMYGIDFSRGQKVGMVGIGFSLLAAVCCPIAGAVAGGMLVWGATSATMSTGAAIALTAAGVIGGGMIGNVAAAVVGWGGMFLSVLAGAAIGSVSGRIEKASAKPLRTPHYPDAGQTFGFPAVKNTFDSSAQKIADKQPVDVPGKKPQGPAL